MNVISILNTNKSGDFSKTKTPDFSPEIQILSKTKITLPGINGLHFENLSDIIFIQAEGNYSVVHFPQNRRIWVCRTLRDLEKVVNDDQRFVRIHRSFCINLEKLQRYQKGKGGQVFMEDGHCIQVSQAKKLHFFNALEAYFGEF